MENKTKKALCLAVLALLLALSIDKTVYTFVIEGNNQNLAPNMAGHPTGTGERLTGVLYWTNDSAIQIQVYGHADTVSQVLSINLSINGTETQKVALRPLGTGENTYASINTIIPKGSNYSVTFLNYHHYEWREYKISTGTAGTGTTTVTTSGGITYDGIYLNNTKLNKTDYFNASTDVSNINHSKVNKTGDTMTGTLFLNATVTSDELANHRVFETNTNGSLRSFITPLGSQYWYLNNTGTPVGLIAYVTPANNPGIAFLNGTNLNRSDFRAARDGFEFGMNEGSGGAPANDFLIRRNGIINIPGLSGAGDGSVCVHANGDLFRC